MDTRQPAPISEDDPRGIAFFHKLDPGTGVCRQCGQKYPCPLLKDAEDVLFGRSRPDGSDSG